LLKDLTGEWIRRFINILVAPIWTVYYDSVSNFFVRRIPYRPNYFYVYVTLFLFLFNLILSVFFSSIDEDGCFSKLFMTILELCIFGNRNFFGFVSLSVATRSVTLIFRWC